jgi:hypothetical protein
MSGCERLVGVRFLCAYSTPSIYHGGDRRMATFNTRDNDSPNRSELAWELAEVFSELRTEQINEVLAKNVPIETLEFFSAYAEDFGRAEGIGGNSGKRLPNLLLLGYLLRILEDRLIEGESFDD